jgi:predicted DsbA family dithiol-disulfide isomerase
MTTIICDHNRQLPAVGPCIAGASAAPRPGGIVHIDIVSDLVCPWCFIGKRRLSRALAHRPDLSVSMSWRAFQLNPDMPDRGVGREAYLAAKFGSPIRAARIYDAIRDTGAAEGIDFAFDRIRRTPNTIAAHRLVRFATKLGKADRMVEALFRAYFEQGRDTGNVEILADIAAESGFERRPALHWLESEAALAEILEEDRNARRLGITGVPCFIIDGGYALSGAQEPEFFLPLFDLAQNAAVPAYE